MLRRVAWIAVLMITLSPARGRRVLRSSGEREYETAGSSSSANAFSSGGKTVVEALSSSSAFTAIRDAAAYSIAEAVASVHYGGSVEAEAEAIAVSTAEAVANAYASSYGQVYVEGHGFGMANAQSHAEAFAEAVAYAYAEAFAIATSDRYQAVAHSVAAAISRGIAQALVRTRVSVNLEEKGYATAAKREHVVAVTRVVASAFADALATVKVHEHHCAEHHCHEHDGHGHDHHCHEHHGHGHDHHCHEYHGADTTSESNAISDSYTQHSTRRHSSHSRFRNRDARLVAWDSHKQEPQQVAPDSLYAFGW